MESHLSSFSPFQNINITAKNEMLSHEVNNHKPTEKMLISFTFCPIKIVIFAQTTLYEHERSFCDNASLWIYFSPAEHKTNGEAIFCQFLDCSSCGKGRERKGIKPKTRISPLLPWAFFCGYLLTYVKWQWGVALSLPHIKFSKKNVLIIVDMILRSEYCVFHSAHIGVKNKFPMSLSLLLVGFSYQ